MRCACHAALSAAASRGRDRIPRRVKTSYRYFMDVWSIDLNLKLFYKIGVYFAGCIDGALCRAHLRMRCLR